MPILIQNPILKLLPILRDTDLDTPINGRFSPMPMLILINLHIPTIYSVADDDTNADETVNGMQSFADTNTESHIVKQGRY